MPFPWIGMNPFETLKQHNRDVSLGLIRPHCHAGEHFSGRLRYVPGRKAVECKDEHIVPAHLASAEIRHLGSQFLVLTNDCLFENVLHPTIAISLPVVADTPVNVAPVVPVKRTVR